ncbi:signal peptidase II [Thermospira aquatica]|uniref:Lipoprotein signal peptidase n=1 Tax=Thermospira aquatica TaxID=2828656 RepID=A0AAX3BGU8_9SPIR|nr:signal peptidase II [Thermospira aquatica]URA11244.1 signal peptidase II [Thermospira aquatica]
MQKSFWRTLVFLLVIFVAVASDQITKALAKAYLVPGETIHVVGDLFVLMYAENEGAFLGLGANLPPLVRSWVLVILPTVLLVVFIVALFLREKNPPLVHVLTMASIVGGGISNLYDRIFYDGRVIDFMNFGIGPVFRTGILNVADLWITFGAIILILLGGKSSSSSGEKNA